MPPKKCPICGREEGVVLDRQNGHALVSCIQCGKYLVSVWGVHLASEDRTFLSCATRQASEAGTPLRIDDLSVPELIRNHKGTTVARNLEKLLSFLGIHVRRPSDSVSVDSTDDFTVIDTDEPKDFDVYLDWLESQGLVAIEKTLSSIDVTLTQQGWAELQPTSQRGGKQGTCFVAMWFDSSMNDAYELGIMPAIEQDCGFKALRIDKKHHNNQITDEIMAGIRGAEFMVADFSADRGGVYYEAGFARGLGRTVIYCCKESEIGKIHFDTKVISHVTWSDPADLRKKLADRIRATIIEKA